MRRGRLMLLTVLAAATVVLCILFLSNPDIFSRTPKKQAAGQTDGPSADPGAPTGELWISELMVGNSKTIPDESGEFHSWLEIYNPGESAVNLNGYGLTDNISKGVKWAFPSVELPAKGYIVVFASGKDIRDTKAAFLHTNFSFKAGEDAALTDPGGNVVDTLAIPATTKGHSIGRSADDPTVYMDFKKPTPGYPNDEAGRAAYERSMIAEDIGLYINEVMPNNRTTIMDEDGDYSDWVEIYNSSDAPIALKGFGLSDDDDARLKWRFPDVTIEPKAYMLIFTSGKVPLAKEYAELHAAFRLSSYQESVVLSDARGRQLDRVDYSEVAADYSYGRDAQADKWDTFSRPTPGFPNSEEGFEAFNDKYAFSPGPLTISEVMTRNADLLKADDGECYDWIKLHNASDQAIDLARYTLSDNTANPTKWRFPESAAIGAGEYLVVLASGRNITEIDSKKKYFETNFGFSGEGEIVTLYDPDARLLDKLNVPKLRSGLSYGRTNGQLRYYNEPSPGSDNGAGYKGLTSTPAFGVTPGIYDGAVDVELKAAEGETIYYTLDASAPTEKSTRYGGAIRVSENTVIRAVSLREGYLTGYSSSGTYLFKSDGVNHALPVASLVMDPDDLWNTKTGIYVEGPNADPEEAYPFTKGLRNYQQRGDEWEREAAFSIFDDDGKEVFSQNIGARIAGAFGRAREQKGFNLIARTDHGESRMDYAFFENRPYESYKALVLRAGAQDQGLSKIRDELATGLLEGSDVNFLYQAYKPYVLYLNGEYWGVYFLKEKRNRFFVAQHENTDNVTDLNLIKSETRVSYGVTDEWKEIMAYVRSHDLSNKDAYDHVAKEIDLSSFMDYIINEIYVANSDYWNIQYYRLPGGKWKWIYYDFCWGWHNVEHKTLALRRESDKPCSDLFNALLKNAGWRDQFVRRFANLMNTIYAPERVIAKIDELYALVEPEIKREREKFNGSDADPGNRASYDSFVNYVKKMREFAQNRPDVIKSMLQSEFGLSESTMREVFG